MQTNVLVFIIASLLCIEPNQAVVTLRRVPQSRDSMQQRTGNFSVAVFVQVGNPDLWGAMRKCVNTVVEARNLVKNMEIDLYVSLVQPTIPGWREAASADARSLARGGIRHVQVDVLENRGADIGQFLLQLQSASAAMKGKPMYDALLKIHTKSSDSWRDDMMATLCGSPASVAQIWQQFAVNKKLGMVGPRGLTWTPYRNDLVAPAYRWAQDAAFPDYIVATMKKVWHIIDPNSPFPKRKKLAIVAGTMFWARGSAVFDERLIAAVPEIWRIGVKNYVTGCRTEECDNTCAMERLLPTFVRIKSELMIPPAFSESGSQNGFQIVY